jgi:hypothetical protein
VAPLYTAKCFWPGVTEDGLRLSAAAADRAGGSETIFRGALYLPADEIVLCLFESPSRAGVRRATEEARLPCERVIETVWVAPPTQWRMEATR